MLLFAAAPAQAEDASSCESDCAQEGCSADCGSSGAPPADEPEETSSSENATEPEPGNGLLLPGSANASATACHVVNISQPTEPVVDPQGCIQRRVYALLNP